MNKTLTQKDKKPVTLYDVYKQVEKANRLFASNMDDLAMKLCKQIIPQAKQIGFSISLDTSSRLVLLERIIDNTKVVVNVLKPTK